MTHATRIHRLALTILVLGATAVPAHAFENAFGEPLPHRDRAVRRPIRVLPPPPPALISGYLPRNHNVPMYNEPPRRPAFGTPWR